MGNVVSLTSVVKVVCEMSVNGQLSSRGTHTQASRAEPLDSVSGFLVMSSGSCFISETDWRFSEM